MRIFATALTALALVGCDTLKATSTVGVELDRGSKYNSWVARHTPVKGRVIRWPTRNIGINIKTEWAKQAVALTTGTGLNFVLGKKGDITFRGYSTARDKVGWSNFYWDNKGRIYKCDVYLNPNYFPSNSKAEVFAHEAMHCAGLNEHTNKGLMSRHGGSKVLAETKGYFQHLYSLPVGSRI